MNNRKSQSILWMSAVVLLFVLIVRATWSGAGNGNPANDRHAADKPIENGNVPVAPDEHLEGEVELWNLKLGHLRLVNASMQMLLDALRRNGARICWEIPADAASEPYVDADGLWAWKGDRPITVDLSGLKLSEALDKFTKADPRYYWKHVPGTSLINIIPHKSKLDFEVESVNITSDAESIVSKIMQRDPAKYLHLKFGRIGGGELPVVTVRMERGTARDFLNEVVKSIPYCWERYGEALRGGGLRFVSAADPIARPRADAPEPLATEIVFPELHRGPQTNRNLQYEVRRIRIGSSWGVGVEKIPLRPRPRPWFSERIRTLGAVLHDPEKTLLSQFVQFMQWFVDEHADGLVRHHVHPDGVQDGNTKYSSDELHAALRKAFEKVDYTQFWLDDFMDADRIKINRLADEKYLVSAKTKQQVFEGKTYFPAELSLTYELAPAKFGVRRWYVVGMHWSGVLAPEK